jgi:hypothetical protein
LVDDRQYGPAETWEKSMSTPTGEHEFLRDLEVEVEADLTMVESTPPEQGPAAEWQFDPADIEREEAGFHNLLGAVQALEGDDPQARQ